MVGLLAGLVLSVLAVASSLDDESADSDAPATVPAEPEFTWAYIDELKVGDCSPDTVDDVGYRMKVVACDTSHHSEIYAIDDLPNGPFPGRGATIGLAEDLCYDAFEKFVGLSYEESLLDYWYYHPIESDWPGDRSVICLVESDWEAKESARGAER